MKIQTIESKTVVIPIENIDTDQIIPARYLKTTSMEGLGDALFFDWRYNADGSPKPDFPLNKADVAGAQILVAGDNFGCGSSREHAVWALADFGFRAVIAPSFADIFRNNCAKIGLLTVVLPQDSIDRLIARAEDSPGWEMEVDLETQTVTLGNGKSRQFDIDPFVKRCLLNGLDDISLTLQEGDAIDAFEALRPEYLPSAR